MANLEGMNRPEQRPFFETLVQMSIGLLFISISATVTPESMKGLVGGTVGLVVCLVLIVRPVVVAISTARSRFSLKERTFIGMMDPRGIVAASTAAAFTAPLVQAHVDGARKLLPVTFMVIVLTVLVYGLGAVPAVRALDLREESDVERTSTETAGSI